MTRIERITELRKRVAILNAQRRWKDAGKLTHLLESLVRLQLRAEIRAERRERRMAS